MRTLTTEQAAQRAKEHVKNAVAALPVQPTLSKKSGLSTECLNPDDNGPRGRYEVDRSYWLNDIPKDRNTEFVDTLYQYWKTIITAFLLTSAPETTNLFPSNTMVMDSGWAW